MLETQFAEWLKREISSGAFRVGAPLPGILELSRSCRVSTTTVRSAIERLAAEGLVRPVRHVGSIVLRRRAGVQRRRILLWEPCKFLCYYSSQFVAALQSELLRGHGSAILVASTTPHGRRPLQQLEDLLQEPWDLVIHHGSGEYVQEILEALGYPFAVVGNGERVKRSSAVNCVGCVEVLNSLALSEFTRHCAARNIGTIAQVCCHMGAYDVTGMMQPAGVKVSTFRTPFLDAPEAVVRSGFKIVDSWFHGGSAVLPDLVLFADDYVAQGGLMALKAHGVRIPEDVAVVTHANKGHGPVWEKPLTRMENDPVAHAAVVAKAVRAFFRGSPFPDGIVLGTVWKDGQTF